MTVCSLGAICDRQRHLLLAPMVARDMTRNLRGCESVNGSVKC